MSRPQRAVSADLDVVDRQILHALVIDGRAPFARIGAVLGVSEQTVARRYRRMSDAGVLRVVAEPGPAPVGYGERRDWFVRLGVRPGGADSVADALARRPETSWVTTTAGGSEVTCAIAEVVPSGPAEPASASLLARLPRSAAVTSVRAVRLLRQFSATADWTAFSPGLPAGAERELVRHRLGPDRAARPVVATEADRPVIDLLVADGRASFRAVAAATGWSESRIARRVAELFAGSALQLDVDLAVGLLGYRIWSYLWITAPPGRVDALGHELIAVPEVSFVGAVTGSEPLLAAVLCRTTDELYRVVTRDVGGLAGVGHVDVAPVDRRVKQAGSLVVGERLTVAGGV